jgi:hypothetical protein
MSGQMHPKHSSFLLCFYQRTLIGQPKVVKGKTIGDTHKMYLLISTVDSWLNILISYNSKLITYKSNSLLSLIYRLNFP